MGGFFGEHKDEILDLIPKEYTVKSIHITKNHHLDEIENLLAKHSLLFPVVLKPNVGERGDGVVLVYSSQEIVDYSETDFLIQEYIDYSLELGVLYAREPNKTEGIVTSLSEKEFLSVVGDGVSRAGDLIKKHARHRVYYNSLKRDYPERLEIVPTKNTIYTVHRIGNHVKGTRFIDANENLSKRLNEVFTELSSKVQGVYYGRYDLKVPSYNDLQAGKNIKIFELNGVSSEPGHIYDQKNVFKAYRDLAHHWLLLITIAHQNIKKGVKTTPFFILLKQVTAHFFG